uniref:Uncharacterized protein n=2 Tax=Haplochromini TaxID=319058 RepID=A0A3Q2X4L3_HAPBU
MLVDDLKIFYLFSFTAYSAQVGGGPHSCHGARGMVHLTQRQLHTYGHTERSQPALLMHLYCCNKVKYSKCSPI